MSSSDISNDIQQQHASTPPAQYNLSGLAGLRGIPALLAADGFVPNGQERPAQTTGGPLTRECSSGSESGESVNQSSTLSHTAPPNNLCQILPPLDAARATGSHPSSRRLHRTFSQLGESGNDDVRAVRPRTSIPQDRLSDESVVHRRVRQGDPSALVLEEIREQGVHEVRVCGVFNRGIFFYTLKLQ